MKVFVDHMITKSKDSAKHTMHLEETFKLLKRYKMKLNLEKCVFEVSLRKFLGSWSATKESRLNPKRYGQSLR